MISGIEKPTTLAPQFDAFPPELTVQHQWVLWRWEYREKWTKPPRTVDGRLASSTDSSTWARFEDVATVYESGDFDGVGFVLEPALGFVGIDLDAVIGDDGATHPEAQRIVREIGSYTEKSPSGRGLRIIARGALPDGWRNTKKYPIRIEMYDTGRFLTITGHRLESPATIEERTAELAALHARVATVIGSENNGRPSETPTIIPDDAELLDRARAARNGAKFSALWAGDTSAHGGDDSAADMALCSLLAFWTGRDTARMDRLFRQSGLMRAKWDKRRGATQTYGERTITAALRACGETYGNGVIRNDGPTSDVPAVADGGLGLVTVGELLSEPDEARAFVVADRLPTAGLGMLAGKPKAGKSTVARCLALAVSRGAPWLGHATVAGPVIYLALEEKRAEVRSHFRALGATASDRVLILCASAPLDALARLRREADRLKPVLIIIDPLFRLIRVDDGNDYATMSAALEPLMVLARETGAHVLLVHHLGKGERAGADAILGSTAILAAVDTALLMRRGDKYRTLESVQRYGPDLEEITITLDPGTRNVEAGPLKADAEQVDAGRLILDYLSSVSEPKTEEEIDGAIECRRQVWKRALRALVARNQITRTGRGGKVDPYRYGGSGSRVPYIPGNQGTGKLFPDLTPDHESEDSGSQVPHGIEVPAVPVPSGSEVVR